MTSEREINRDLLTEKQNKEIERIKKDWNGFLISVLERTYKELGRPLPQLPAEELVRQAPNLLEIITRDRVQHEATDHQFIILSGPSGSGKGTVGKVLEAHGFVRLPRMTTRRPRPGETAGADYIFTDRAEFERLAAADEFIGQTAVTHGEYRGTPRQKFNELIAHGQRFYVEGSAAAYQEFIGDRDVSQTKFLSAFLLPPSFEILEERLRRRDSGSIAETEIIQRLEKAVEHLQKTKDYHYDVYYVNDIVDRVAENVEQDF